MKKLLIYLLLLSSFAIATADERNGPNDQGIYQVFNHNARFKGRLLVDGCRIEPRNITINLGSMTVQELKAAGVGEWGYGKLNFEQCNLNNENEGVKVSGIILQIPAQNLTPGTTRPDLWSNQAQNDIDGARGLGIEIWVKGDKDVQVTQAGTGDGEYDGIKATIDGETVSYEVRGRMVLDNTKYELTTGRVESSIYFRVLYK